MKAAAAMNHPGLKHLHLYTQEPMSISNATPLYFSHGVFIDRFIFRSNFPGIMHQSM